jgi:hypothetical protein
MPIYPRHCIKCGGWDEVILKVSERDAEIICSTCHIVMIPTVTVPAKTATLWNGGWNSGLSGQGFYSHSVGGKVHSRRDEANIMAKKGFAPESDLPKHWFEDRQAELIEKRQAQEALTNTYINKVTEYGGDKVRAMSETFDAKSCLDGTLDKIYDTTIKV